MLHRATNTKCIHFLRYSVFTTVKLTLFRIRGKFHPYNDEERDCDSWDCVCISHLFGIGGLDNLYWILNYMLNSCFLDPLTGPIFFVL